MTTERHHFFLKHKFHKDIIRRCHIKSTCLRVNGYDQRTNSFENQLHLKWIFLCFRFCDDISKIINLNVIQNAFDHKAIKKKAILIKFKIITML